MTGQRITEVFAFVAVGDDGHEGIVSFHNEWGNWPMIGANTERVESLKPAAQAMADETGIRIEIIRLSLRDTIGVIAPGGATP